MPALSSVILLLVSMIVPQDSVAPAHSAEYEAERQKANELYLAGRAVEALPLYEHLEQVDPSRAVYAERRAAGLIAKSATVTTKAEETRLLSEAYAELLRAQKLGDNTAYVLNQLDAMKTFANGGRRSDVGSESPAVGLVKTGEAAFARNDYAAALKAYSEAATADPKSYQAALFAGDTSFRLHDTEAAGMWFTRAIAIEPNVETAYRYWGDALLVAGQPNEAREKFIDAIVAEPYVRASWSGLTQWAERTRHPFAFPAIKLPAFSGDGHHLQVPEEYVTEDGTGRSAWFTYLKSRQHYLHEATRLQGTSPTPYRHSLADEAASLRAAIADLRAKTISPEKLDPSLKALEKLDQERVLEPWILLHNANAGIAKDYAAYREAHREQLHRYIAEIDLRAPLAGASPQ